MSETNILARFLELGRQFGRQLRSTNERQLFRTLVALGVVTLIVALIFAGIYYRDRYVAPANPMTQSTTQREIAHLEDQVRQDPNNLDLRVALAERYLVASRWQDTFTQADQVLKVDPDYQGALYLRAMASQQLDQPEPAIADLERIIELNQDNPMAKVDQRLEAVYYYAGTLYTKQGQYEQAVAALQSALEINRTDADAWFALGQALHLHGQDQEAVGAFQQAIRFVPDFVEAFAGMEQSYRALGQQPQADYAAGMVAFGNHDYDRAVQLLEAVAQTHPELVEVYLGLGLAYERANALDKALAAVEHYVAARPDDVAGQQTLARLRQNK